VDKKRKLGDWMTSRKGEAWATWIQTVSVSLALLYGGCQLREMAEQNEIPSEPSSFDDMKSGRPNIGSHSTTSSVGQCVRAWQTCQHRSGRWSWAKET
jgi:hypothetical protein